MLIFMLKSSLPQMLWKKIKYIIFPDYLNNSKLFKILEKKANMNEGHGD